MKDKIKQTLTHNMGYKLLALFLGFLVWLLILNTEDPVETRDITDIAITEINAEQITDAGKAYSYAGDVSTVSVRVRGKSSLVSRLTRNDFSAVVDLSKLSITGAVTADVTCPRYTGLEITPIGSSTVLNVEIEDVLNKSFNVRVLTSENSPPGKYIGAGTATPNLVTVSGPVSVVEQIKEAVVIVNVTSFNTAEITTGTDVILRRSNGDEIKTSSLELSQSRISVKVPIYNTKSVPVKMEIAGEPAEGYEILSYEYEPKEITLAGPDEELAEIEEIVLEDYDLSGASESIEETIPVAGRMTQELPSDVVFTDTEAAIAFAADIQPVIEKSFEVSLDKVLLNNTKTGYSYEKGLTAAENSDNKVTLTVRGAQSLVESLSAASLNVSADVSKCTSGNNSVTLSVDLEEGLTLTENVTINVKMTSVN